MAARELPGIAPPVRQIPPGPVCMLAVRGGNTRQKEPELTWPGSMSCLVRPRPPSATRASRPQVLACSQLARRPSHEQGRRLVCRLFPRGAPGHSSRQPGQPHQQHTWGYPARRERTLGVREQALAEKPDLAGGWPDLNPSYQGCAPSARRKTSRHRARPPSPFVKTTTPSPWLRRSPTTCLNPRLSPCCQATSPAQVRTVPQPSDRPCTSFSHTTGWKISSALSRSTPSA